MQRVHGCDVLAVIFENDIKDMVSLLAIEAHAAEIGGTYAPQNIHHASFCRLHVMTVAGGAVAENGASQVEYASEPPFGQIGTDAHCCSHVV